MEPLAGVRGIHQPDDPVQQPADRHPGRCSIYGGHPVVLRSVGIPAGTGGDGHDPALRCGIRPLRTEHRYLYHGGAGVHRNKVNARRTTIIHLMFNIIGTAIFTVICMVTPYVGFIESLTPGDPVSQIANAHTIFNIVTTLLLLPFGTYMAKAARRSCRTAGRPTTKISGCGTSGPLIRTMRSATAPSPSPR